MSVFNSVPSFDEIIFLLLEIRAFLFYFLQRHGKLTNFQTHKDNKITLHCDPEAIWKLAVEEHDKLKRNVSVSVNGDSNPPDISCFV